MWKVMLIGDEDLTAQLCSLPLWGEISGFVIGAVQENLPETISLLNEYELILADLKNGISLLMASKKRSLNPRIVLCGPKDFAAARQGLILGVYDYIFEPVNREIVVSMLSRKKEELLLNDIPDRKAVVRLMEYLEARDESYYAFLQKTADKLSFQDKDLTYRRIKQIFQAVWEELLEKYPWFDLYVNESVYRTSKKQEKGNPIVNYIMKLRMLFEDFCELYPKHQQNLSEVFAVILNGPEDDLRLKTVSSKIHMNATYLSTVFQARTGIYFVDYIQTVKMKRAAWLLLNTDFSIAEIAGRLHYKDISYFSRMFREKYGVAPSVFRIPEDYNFQI